jgi:glutamine amidotransferase
MCRWLAYLGQPVYLEKYLFEPEHSLISQSLHPERTAVTANGDGFGVGWYGERAEPGLYREILPAWNDPNLRSLAAQIRARLFFAHVRASTGTETSRVNCHPFVHGNWMFMHNGQIGGYERIRRALDSLLPDDLYAKRRGTTDSEAFFYLLFRFGLEKDPEEAWRKTVAAVLGEMDRAGIPEPFRMTAILTDGKTLYGLRYATDPSPPSLYWHCDRDELLVVSEPLDSDKVHWSEVPAQSLLLAEGRGEAAVEPFQI